MSHYIDGFVLPIPRDHLDTYKRVVEAVAEIWKEHGALDYREYIGDDMSLEGTRSFPDLVAAGENEAIVFGWVVFESREARDRGNEKVEADRVLQGLHDKGRDQMEVEMCARLSKNGIGLVKKLPLGLGNDSFRIADGSGFFSCHFEPNVLSNKLVRLGKKHFRV